MKLIIILYLFLGVITCGKLTGHGPWPHESQAFVIGGNALLLLLLIVGFVHATRKDKFLGFDKWIWLAMTIGAYAAGAISNATFLNQ